MNSLKPRLLTAVVGISLLLIIMVGGYFFAPLINIIVGCASAFMAGEYLHARNMLKNHLLSVPCILFSFLLSLLISTDYLYLLLAVFMIAVFAVMIAKHFEIAFIDLAYAVTGTLLISFGMGSISILRASDINFIFCFVTIFALPWMADAGGFFMGAAFGRHKLCPNISPKKTVEGAVGGVVFCLLTSVIIWVVFQFVAMPDYNFNLWALLLLALIDAPVSILGDLSFSLLKRNLDIKDYGSIFPGHGGMLDRFDSIIFTVPVMAAINQFMPFVTLG